MKNKTAGKILLGSFISIYVVIFLTPYLYEADADFLLFVSGAFFMYANIQAIYNLLKK